jgi:hypothetical protein
MNMTKTLATVADEPEPIEAGTALARPAITACATQQDAETLVAFRAAVRDRAAAIEAWFAPQVAQAHALHKDLVGKRDEALRPYREAEAWAVALVKIWQRRVEEARRQALAAQQEAARQQAAAKAAAAGDTATAGAILTGEQVTPANSVPPVALPSSKLAGFCAPKVWRAECLDLAALVRAIAAGAAPIALVVFDAAAAKQHARETNGAPIAGVKTWKE